MKLFRRTWHLVSILTLLAVSAYASQEPAPKQQENEPKATTPAAAPEQQPATPTKITLDGSINVVNQPDPKAEQRYADERADAKFDQRIDIATLFVVGVAAWAAIAAWRANKRSADAEEAQVALLTTQLNEARTDATEQRRIANDALAESRTTAAAANRHADTAEKAMVAAQRPWVLGADIRVQHWLDATPFHYRSEADLDLHPEPRRKGFMLSVIWKNFGVTPALNVRAFSNAEKIGPDGISKFVAGHLDRSKWPPSGTLAPQGAFVSKGIGLTFDELDAIALEDLTVLIYGHIEYADRFTPDTVHHTDTCYRVQVVANPRTSDNPFAFLGHHDGHRAD